jgi:parvulin-like peptidyl-prolyl isomerase
MLSSICGSPPSLITMASSLRKLLPLLLLALAVTLVAACGSSDSSKTVPSGAVALVGDKAIEKTALDRLIAQTKTNYEAQKQEFPEVGTPEYETLKGTLLKGLVQQSQWEQAGAAMGVRVSQKEIDTQLDALKQQYFKGDEDKFKAELDKQGLTVEQLREQLRARVLSDKIYSAVIKKVKVTDAKIKAYYDGHKAQFQQPESREVRHILVKKESLADELYAKLKDGADFAKLASKYTEDEASKAEGGKLTAYKGKTVAPFDKFVFAAKTGDLSKPVKTEFGWHLIEVLSEVKPATPQPLAEAKETISSTLLQQQQNEALKAWVKDAQSKYDVTYAPGYAPASTGTTETGTSTG